MSDPAGGGGGFTDEDVVEISAHEEGSILAAFDRSAIMGDINVTPMVDVMLVLLIIFMVVTPALVAGFQAQLPVGMNLKERPEEEGRTVMGIDAGGAYYLDTRPIPTCGAADRATAQGRAQCAAEARNRLVAAFQTHPQDRVLFVKAHAGLKYQEMIDVMRLAKGSGARVVAAVTEQTPVEEPEE